MQMSKESEQIRISSLIVVTAHHGGSLLLEVLSRTDNRDGPMLIFVSHYGRSGTTATHRQTILKDMFGFP